MRWLLLGTVLLLAVAQNAHAFLEDKEARKKITENQTQNQTAINALNNGQQALEARIGALEATVKGQGQGLLDLLGQIEHLNQELARIKGELEVATHELANAQQRQRDLYADTDTRLRRLESGGGKAAGASADDAPSGAAETGSEPSGGTADQGDAESRDFAAAQALAQASRHREAFDAFDRFLQDYPSSAHAPEATYALGYAQFSLKNYKASIATQQKFLQRFPDHALAPDAMFNIANAQIQLSDIEGAKKTLRTLLAQYPKSEVAPSAQKRLALLETIKLR